MKFFPKFDPMAAKRAADMPKLATQTTKQDTIEAFTEDAQPTGDATDGNTDAVETSAVATPTMVIPLADNNPFIARQKNPTGTVFIAVGAIVGAILLAFILYHLIISVVAAKLAKRNVARDKRELEKYNMNAAAYGYGVSPSTTTFLDFGTRDLRVPLLNRASGMGFFPAGPPLSAADTSTIYQLEAGAATLKHDLTKMFVSPTAEMQHKRAKSYAASATNLSFANNGLATNLPGNRHLTLIPLMYMDNGASEQLLDIPKRDSHGGRKTIPSMYLEDLIDLDKSPSH